MYDKISLWIDRSQFDTNDYCKLETLLSNSQILKDMETQRTILKGGYKGLKVQIGENGVFIAGSLSGFYYPSNCYTLTRSDTQKAISNICDMFKFHPDDCHVSMLEFGTMFPMKKQVSEYIQMLGAMPRMQRATFSSETLYYFNQSKTKLLRFYNKKKDVISKHQKLPIGLEDANLLRYEIAINRRLSQQLKKSKIVASTLYQKEFYKLLKDKYKEEYKKIKRQNTMSMDVSGIKSVSDAFNLLMAWLYNDADKSKIEAFINTLKANNVFSDRKYYTRLKQKIESIQEKEVSVISKNDLIRELDDCIQNIDDYL